MKLTEAQFLALPSREQDTLVAERVMGLQKVISPGFGAVIGWAKSGFGASPLPHYSTNIAAAWEVVAQMHSRGFSDLSLFVDSDYDSVSVTFWNGEDRGMADANSVPLALCLAALKAVGAVE